MLSPKAPGGCVLSFGKKNSSGSQFTYFETKADLFNQLFLELKTEMTVVALQGFPAKDDLRKQVFYVWSNWMDWATSDPPSDARWLSLVFPTKSRQATRAAARETMAGLSELMDRIRSNGSLRNSPRDFAVAIMNSLADATMDFMIHDPTNAKKHCKNGFEAFWRAID